MSEAIWLALALVLVLEGAGPMLFPRKWRIYIRLLTHQPIEQLRTIGGVMVVVGLVSLWFLL